jgi:hypothetical protein
MQCVKVITDRSFPEIWDTVLVNCFEIATTLLFKYTRTKVQFTIINLSTFVLNLNTTIWATTHITLRKIPLYVELGIA